MSPQEKIIHAIKSGFGYEHSNQGQVTSFEGLQKMIPNLTRSEIILAIQEMDGVEVIDSGNGAIHLPASYFK